MTVKIKCPQGHALVAQEQHKGKVGRCPKCGAAVTIPDDSVSDDELADLLSEGVKPEAYDHEHVLGSPEAQPGGGSTSKASGTGPMKLCPKCDSAVPVGFMICPSCRTYLSWSGVSASKSGSGLRVRASGSGKASVDCPSCGAKTFPGDTVCHNCGAHVEL